ncbi:MAG: hypothetical protein RID91_08945 [Azospirillaceae bacterium]
MSILNVAHDDQAVVAVYDLAAMTSDRGLCTGAAKAAPICGINAALVFTGDFLLARLALLNVVGMAMTAGAFDPVAEDLPGVLRQVQENYQPPEAAGGTDTLLGLAGWSDVERRMRLFFFQFSEGWAPREVRDQISISPHFDGLEADAGTVDGLAALAPAQRAWFERETGGAIVGGQALQALSLTRDRLEVWCL